MALNYNIGAGDKPIDGWINIDMGDDVYLTTVRQVNHIYTSHFLEYFDKVEVMILLKCWHNAICNGGVLQISVPDFSKVVEIYQNEGIIMDGALYGKMGNYINVTNKNSGGTRQLIPGNGGAHIYHKSAFDKKTLREALLLAGFRNVTEFEPFHDDCSKDPISLNLQCRK